MKKYDIREVRLVDDRCGGLISCGGLQTLLMAPGDIPGEKDYLVRVIGIGEMIQV